MLVAYHGHEAHSAWRCLLKDNPWIDASHSGWAKQRGQSAPYTYSSHVEQFKELVALFYCLTEDTKLWGIACNTYFLIMRAHNFDQERINPRTKKLEEYNNVSQSDLTSCSLGITRRFFNGIAAMARASNHDLDKDVLTKVGLIKEMKGFYINYFSDRIKELPDDKRGSLNQDLQDELYVLDDASKDVISFESGFKEAVVVFKESLEERLPEDFNDTRKEEFDDFFTPDAGKSYLAMHYDVLKDLFEAPAPAPAPDLESGAALT